jgi:hypothetical protein
VIEVPTESRARRVLGIVSGDVAEVGAGVGEQDGQRRAPDSQAVVESP